MKFTYILSLTLFLGLTGQSFAESEGGMLDKLKASFESKDAVFLCSRGEVKGANTLEKFKSLFKSTQETGNIYTLRSFDGVFCNIQAWAAFAALTCTDPSIPDNLLREFKGSKCWGYGKKFFGNPDDSIDTAKAQEYILSILQTPAGAYVKKGVCWANKGPLKNIPIIKYMQQVSGCAVG